MWCKIPKMTIIWTTATKTWKHRLYTFRLSYFDIWYPPYTTNFNSRTVEFSSTLGSNRIFHKPELYTEHLLYNFCAHVKKHMLDNRLRYLEGKRTSLFTREFKINFKTQAASCLWDKRSHFSETKMAKALRWPLVSV